MVGVILHVIGDAINNLGVMVAALVIWKTESDARYYADPAVSLFIAMMIFATAIPLVKHSGSILLQITPPGVSLDDIEHDLMKASGRSSGHTICQFHGPPFPSPDSCSHDGIPLSSME
jgi:zinc transporter 1